MYERIKKLRRDGKTPVVKLLPGMFVPVPKRPRGRPRKYPEGHPIAARYRGRRGKNRPYCAARGCKRQLRMHQEIACSETCKARIINDAILRLQQCGITAPELVTLYGQG